MPQQLDPGMRSATLALAANVGIKINPLDYREQAYASYATRPPMTVAATFS
jgi:hypothetical protein